MNTTQSTSPILDSLKSRSIKSCSTPGIQIAMIPFSNDEIQTIDSQHVIRERAVRLAVRTGIASDLDFVWQWQKNEGSTMCFGAHKSTCPKSCRWFSRCKPLTEQSLDDAWPILRSESTSNDR